MEDVQFATKQSVLSKRALVILRALANHMERRPELKLDVDGHTDNIGDAQDNLALSVDRAHAVKDFLDVVRDSKQPLDRPRPRGIPTQDLQRL